MVFRQKERDQIGDATSAPGAIGFFSLNLNSLMRVRERDTRSEQPEILNVAMFVPAGL
jgi:hypothetical protein